MQSFEVCDQAIVGCGRQRIATNQQGMKAEGHAQSMVRKVVADFVPDIAITLQADHVGSRTYQRT